MAESPVMNWDELNLLRSSVPDLLNGYRKTKDRKEVDRWLDYMGYVLCLCYGYGWQDAETVVGTVRMTDGLDDKCVNLEIEGETFRERVFRQLDEDSLEGILRIVDTESHRDYNTGVYDAGKLCGKPEVKKQWWTMEDGRVREQHDYLHGVKVGIDDRFYTYTGESTLYPGGFGVPELDINCRCWVTLTL